ncbi:MAG: hypothetical protein HYV45_01200 [Candidatus Moranbacteria bacterium]|nr:hypothetical protein [Candidatus Moranbacteria bacterium]
MFEKHPLHIKNPELQKSADVQHAVVRDQRHTGEKIPNDPKDRIEAYTDRLENIFLNPDSRVRERNIDLLRPKIYDSLIIKRGNFPDSYFELQKRVAREQGHGDIEISQEMREQMIDTAIADQRHSLDAWIDYLSSEDAVYPAWFKYYAWNQITKLSQFDKERGEFKKRTESTVAPFPDIYREPLAQMADLYERVKQDNKDPEARAEFDKKFPNLYAELIVKSLEAGVGGGETIEGAWVKFEQGEEGAAEKLFQSLDGRGTGWCTAGYSTAQTQIESGDFYVYYTNDKDGNPIQPRLAIRMNGDTQIGEVRGVLPQQNVEPLMQEVLEEKLQAFGKEADAYHKRSSDMKMLTVLENKKKQGIPFAKEDLTFLYEINSTIEGFGYQEDPRIAELRADRNTERDMLVIFDCTQADIARTPSEIRPTTKAYVGQLEPGIFQKLPATLEHVYTAFPEGKVRRIESKVGGKSAGTLQEELEAAQINIGGYAESMLKNKKEFIATPELEEMTLIRLTVADLGFKSSATTDQIYKRAEELGLELCPSDVGPTLRLQYQNQPLGEWLYIGMKQIADSDGNPGVFMLARDGGGLWLDSSWARPSSGWNPDGGFVFRLRKSES